MKNQYDVVIIGAGIGGLICGNYLAKEGLQVLIVEQEKRVGGYCASFERSQYTFDIGVHYLGGIKRGVLGKILDELILRDEIEFCQFDPTDKIIMPNDIIYIRKDSKETIASFQECFEDEKENIKNFFHLLINEKFIKVYNKYKRLTFQEILDSFFKNKELQGSMSILLENIGLPASKIAGLTALILFKEFILDPGYYPTHGMQEFPDMLAKRFYEKGGKVLLSTKVSKILTQNNKATGVLLENNEIVFANIIVSNADATKTFNQLLDIKLTKECDIVKKMEPSLSVFAVYLGLNIGLKNILKEPCNIWCCDMYDIEKHFSNLRQNLLNQKITSLLVTFPSLHRFGQGVDSLGSVQAFVNAPYDSLEFWNQQRDVLCDAIIDKIKIFIPSLEKFINIKLTATPHTFERYTCNRNGATYGWAPTMKQSNNSLLPQQTSVQGLILAGHWCATGFGEGGVSGVAGLGRNAARIILASYDKKWKYPIFLL